MAGKVLSFMRNANEKLSEISRVQQTPSSVQNKNFVNKGASKETETNEA
jgi:hypothetical protein